jgi:hypothetical protein
MASLPNNTAYAPGKFFFAENTMNPQFSTLTVSEGYAIDGTRGQTFDILATSISTINTLAVTQYPNAIQTDWQQQLGINTQQEYVVSMANQNNVVHAYSYDGDLKAALVLTSSINAGNGGVQLFSEGGTNLSVRDEGVSMTGIGGSNGSLNVYFANPSNAYIQHFPAPAVDLASEIHFNSATSSISLVSATGQSLGVGTFGIGLNPGSNSAVTLQSGYLNMSNLAMSNVSTINGAPVANAPVQWINPISGPFPTATTPGGAGTITPLAYFSTTQGNITRVSVAFQSDNGTGGNPTDQTQLALVAYSSSPPFGPTGVVKYLDTYPAVQTDDPNGPYQFATSFDFQCQDSQAGVVMINLTQNGNTQNGTLFGLTTQDMGAPIVKY